MFSPDTRFLVVDDFATMRKIIKKVLAELGYTNVEEADDGQTALPKIKEAQKEGNPFGFVVSDWNMPGMTGIDLLRAVRADENLKATPFMLVTAESEQKNVVEAVQAGVNDYVVKPFNAATIKAKFEAIYNRLNKAA
ncbi:MAG: response regulator [Bdellovibrionota bacterium]|nr:response regulator [Bdellovibrionota bacterium]